jgi:hypothetical protein
MAFAKKRKFFCASKLEAAQRRSRRIGRNGATMKIARVSKGLLLGIALLLATSALASNHASVAFTDAVTVNGTQLPAGDYQMKWEGSGNNVQLSFVQGKKVVATTTARMVDLKQSANDTAAVVQKNADGTRSLTQVRLGGKSYAFDIGSEAGGAEDASK